MAEGSTEFSADALMDQIRRLARLDTTVFEEVRDAQSQTLPALVVVIVGVVLSALGGWLWLEFEFSSADTGDVLLRGVLLGSAFAIALWAVWVLVTQVVLLNMFNPESTDGLGCAGCRARNGRFGGCGSGWWRWQGATVAVRACGQEETAVGRRSQACWRQAVERSARPSGVRSGAGSLAAGRGRR